MRLTSIGLVLCCSSLSCASLCKTAETAAIQRAAEDVCIEMATTREQAEACINDVRKHLESDWKETTE